MINKNLTCHTGTPSNASQNITVTLDFLAEGTLRLSYKLTGDLTQIRVPKAQNSTAVDGLWQHTCFELFIAVEGEANYHEFNFSPSGQWAAYAFSDYRVISEWTLSQKPTITFVQTKEYLNLVVVIPVNDLDQSIAGKPIELGITAVIEANDGGHSYWALHHPLTHPDFHHREGFILSLNQG
jgi:hypothetical protein